MTLAMLRVASSEPTPLLHLRALAMWRAQPGALLVLGRAATPLPKRGTARMTGMAGVFRAETWQLPDDAGYGFLMAVRLPEKADRADAAELILRGGRGTDRNFRLTAAGTVGGAEFGREAASLVRSEAGRVARFLLDVMQPDGHDTHHPASVLNAFLAHAARQDGCVELIMHVPQRWVVLQGWGTPLPDKVELLVPNSAFLRLPADPGQFPRPDIIAPATGSVLTLSPDVVGAIAGLDRMFLLAGDDLLCRHVVDPRVLDQEASIGQVRHLLPKLNCSAPVHALLRATLLPEFKGHDTLNATSLPVRAALDAAALDSKAGAYIAGWVFDPSGHVAELHLCAGTTEARLNENWVRIARKDVSEAFRTDPAFPARSGHEWGFAVSVSTSLPAGEPAYLRFTFTDGDFAFFPIRQTTSPMVPALLASVDLHKASGFAVIEHHLAPFIGRLSSSQPANGRVLLRGPLDRKRAIVVPLRTAILPRSFISNFLLDPAADDEQIVFVCGPEWDHVRREALVGLIQFYALPASIIAIDRSPLPAASVLEAEAVTQADSFLLASPGLVGNTPGWRDALHEASLADAVACPTILFEDASLRYAGSQRLTFLDRSPFVDIHAPLAGASADLAGRGEPDSAENGTFACCLIRRAALSLLSRAAPFQTEAGQETGYFLAMREAGMSTAWIKAIQVSAPEEDAPIGPAAASLVDGWILRQIWGELSPCAS